MKLSDYIEADVDRVVDSLLAYGYPADLVYETLLRKANKIKCQKENGSTENVSTAEEGSKYTAKKDLDVLTVGQVFQGIKNLFK